MELTGYRPAWNRPHAVYRHWNADGLLLYVGVAVNPERRWLSHRTNSWGWVFDVTASQVTWYPTRGLAHLAEWVAIDTEHPLFNVSTALPTRARTSRYADGPITA